MHKLKVGKRLKRIFIKLYKKDPKRYGATMGKIDELVACENPDHYKNLRKPLQHLKAVHVDSHFVLTFKYVRSDNMIKLYDFDHHDKIYK